MIRGSISLQVFCDVRDQLLNFDYILTSCLSTLVVYIGCPPPIWMFGRGRGAALPPATCLWGVRQGKTRKPYWRPLSVRRYRLLAAGTGEPYLGFLLWGDVGVRQGVGGRMTAGFSLWGHMGVPGGGGGQNDWRLLFVRRYRGPAAFTGQLYRRPSLCEDPVTTALFAWIMWRFHIFAYRLLSVL